MEWQALAAVGFALILIGMMLIFLSVLMSKGDGKVEGGGVVIIGPVPIVFGTSITWAIVAMVLAIILMVLAIILMRMRVI